MVRSFLFDFADKMLNSTSTLDFGTDEEMYKMTDHLLYLSKKFRHVGSATNNFD